MRLNILVALWISIFSSLQISQNKLKNENQFQVQVQQNGDQAKKTSSVKVFLQPPSDFYSTGPENITVISSRPKNAPYATKKAK